MRYIKTTVTILFFFFTITPFLSNFNISSTCINNYNISNSKPPDVYLIKDVPYVSQETNFLCGYATATMIFKYYGINTSLSEVVYHSGVGYSLIYQNFEDPRIPHNGWIIGLQNSSCNFVSNIFGLSYEKRDIDSRRSYDDQWDKDWKEMKHNISNDIPVIVKVDEVILASDNLGFGIFYPFLKSKIFNFHHFVLILGYNETNQTVCYNDPIYGIFNKSDYGKYRWVDIEKFKTSTRKISKSMFVRLFRNTSKKPISIEEAFNKSHKINIEKLKGNSSVYFNDTENPEIYSYGINALKKLRQYFDIGLENRVKTFYKFKLYNRLGLIYRLMNFLYNKYHSTLTFNPDDLWLDENDKYANIAVEKKITANFLNQIKDDIKNEELSEICEYESTLFECEAENWTKIAENYSEFRKKGIFMPFYKGLQIMKNIGNLLEDIIKIEEEIISGPPKN